MTEEKLRAMTPGQRFVLYKNAKDRYDSGGKEVIDMIDNLGLSLSEGGLTADHPIYLRMTDIIWSLAGRTAAKAAADANLPALAGIDPILQRELGQAYEQLADGTRNAGYILAELMRHEGYIENGSGLCPPNCIAKTGLMWRPRT